MNRSAKLRLPLLLIASTLAALLLAAPASAYSVEERVQYFGSGKYQQDLDFVAERGKRWIVKRTAKTLPVIRACERAGYRVGRKDPGPDPAADYTVPVPVPPSEAPRSIVAAPNPGPAGAAQQVEGARTSAAAKGGKAKRKARVTRKRCAKTQRLAIATDMDETTMSSFRYGSPQPNYDIASMLRNMVLGSQTALEPMLEVYELARRREVDVFVITARYDPLTADPLVGALTGGADLCSPSLAPFGACGIDIATYDFRTVTRENLEDEGYGDIRGLYMRPPNSESKGQVKNAQRAEIVNRRHYDLIAMFGDQDTDLEGGFFERGFKFQSPE